MIKMSIAATVAIDILNKRKTIYTRARATGKTTMFANAMKNMSPEYFSVKDINGKV